MLLVLSYLLRQLIALLCFAKVAVSVMLDVVVVHAVCPTWLYIGKCIALLDLIVLHFDTDAHIGLFQFFISVEACIFSVFLPLSVNSPFNLATFFSISFSCSLAFCSLFLCLPTACIS